MFVNLTTNNMLFSTCRQQNKNRLLNLLQAMYQSHMICKKIISITLSIYYLMFNISMNIMKRRTGWKTLGPVDVILVSLARALLQIMDRKNNIHI